jgi:hypothetical protein
MYNSRSLTRKEFEMAITAEDTAMYNEAKGEYIEEVCRMLDTPDLTTETVLLNVMGCL